MQTPRRLPEKVSSATRPRQVSAAVAQASVMGRSLRIGEKRRAYATRIRAFGASSGKLTFVLGGADRLVRLLGKRVQSTDGPNQQAHRHRVRDR